MDQQIDEIDEFFFQRRTKKRRLIGLVGSLVVAVCLAYAYLPGHLGQLLAFGNRAAVDDPRVWAGVQRPTTEEEALEPYRELFSREFPSYVDALRKYRKRNVAHSGEDQGEELQRARAALIQTVSDDEALLAAVNVLTHLAEDSPTVHEQQIEEALNTVNLLLADRGLPFRGSVEIDKSQAGSLKARFYEQVGQCPFAAGGDEYTVAYLDRLDLTSLYRDPEVWPSDGRDPIVYTRVVSTATNGTLFAALNPHGFWRLSRIDPPRELEPLEPLLATHVFRDWQEYLEPRLRPRQWRAFLEVSEKVAKRNRMYREVNQRDPANLVMLEPSSLQLNWNGEAWLEELKPYAVQGLVRLMLEDITRLRLQDREMGKSLDAAAPAIRKVLEEQLRLAAVAEVTRVAMLRKGPPPPDVLVAEHGIGMATTVATLRAAYLAQLIEHPVSSVSVVAELAAQSVDGDNRMPARWVLEQLSGLELGDNVPDPAALSTALRGLEPLSAEELSQRAAKVFEEHFGPYHSVRPTGGVVADMGHRGDDRDP